MKNKWLKLATSLIAMLIVAAVIVGVAMPTWAQGAQNGPNQNQTSYTRWGGGAMLGGRFGFGGGETLTIIAKTLTMSEADLLAALQSGKTVADITKEKGVALQTVVDAIIAKRQSVLDQAVTDGKITQAQADLMIAQMKANLPTHLSSPFVPGKGRQGDCDPQQMFGGRGGRGTGMGYRHPFGWWDE